MKKECDKPSRLVCNYCNISTHAHQNDFVLFKDVNFNFSIKDI